jgi:hypothetical protein
MYSTLRCLFRTPWWQCQPSRSRCHSCPLGPATGRQDDDDASSATVARPP